MLTRKMAKGKRVRNVGSDDRGRGERGGREGGRVGIDETNQEFRWGPTARRKRGERERDRAEMGLCQAGQAGKGRAGWSTFFDSTQGRSNETGDLF